MKTNHWLRAASLTAALALASAMLTACADTSASSGNSVTASTSAASDSASASGSSAISLPEEPADSSETSQSTEASSLPSTSLSCVFAEAGDYTNEDFRPLLTLEADGTATFRENLLEGMGTFTGRYRYAETDGTLILTVESVDFAESFVCYNIREIVFTVQDDNTLVLQTELCASVPGAVFSRMA